MNKIWRIICGILIITSLVISINAIDETLYIYDYPDENISVEFQRDTSFSEDIRRLVADSIVYGTPLSQTYSLCWLIGHDITVETVSAIYHKRMVDDPRCQWEIYDVDKCSNCDYVYPRLVSSSYISCCPPEASAVSIDDSYMNQP